MTPRLEDDRLAVLVHEVRSPVAALAAVAETVTEPDGGHSARQELVRLAVAACRAIERVILDVAVVSVRREPVDVGVLVREAVAGHLVRGHDVVVAGDAGGVVVDGDPVRLRQVVDNLVANALIHGESRVTVEVGGTGEEVHVAVADTGPGIPESDRERIFELGVRLGGGAAGSGLGLALVRAIVEAHGGYVSVDSTLGSGTTFTVVLPAGTGQPDTRASSS